MKQMKKLLAFVLAFAMIITIYQPSAAYAATQKTRLNAKTMTLQVGQKKTLKVKNAGKKAKLKWSSNKKSIATVSKKGVVKAVKAGNAVVTCKVTTKNGKTTKLTCKVAVKKTAKVTSLTVGSQSELEKALKNKNVTKITVATQGAVTFTVPQGNYSKVDLVINAPNADVVNNGKFKSIDIQAIKPNTYRENAKGNVITVSATGDARVIVETGATVAKIMVSGSKGNVKLVVDGTLSGITIDAPVNVTVEGKTTAAVPVTVNEKAAGANVTSSTPVEVKAAAPIALNLTKGAEGSKVETTSDKAEVTVKNETTQAVTVTTPAGSKDVAKDTTSKVDNAGKVTDVADNTDANNNGGGATGGGSSSGGGITPVPSIGKIGEFSVMGRNKLSIYPDDVKIVPETVANENITVTDANGRSIRAAEIKRDADGESGYYVTLASDMVNGTYTFTMLLQGKTYTQEFTYNDSVWSVMDEAQKVIKEYEQSKPTASVSALKNPKICQKVLLDGIMEKFNEDPALKTLDLEVNYEEKYTVNGSELTAAMWIAIYGDNDAKYELYDDVTFVCTESEIQVSAPEIKHILKHSLVVAVEPTYEYACVTSGTAISAITEDEWVQGNESDDFGCYEMSGLKENTEYVVYKRIIDVDEYYGSSTATTGGEETICLAEADENAKNVNVGNVKAGDRISIPLKGLKVVCYAKPKDGFEHGDFDFRCDDEMNKLLWDGYWSLNSYDKDNNLLVTFTVPEQLESGKVYTVKICYNFECSKESDNPDEWGDLITKSDDLIYTVTFTVE